MKNTPRHPLQSYYSRIFKTYDLVNRLFTFGLDRKWRRYTVNVCLESHPASILDLCCGTGNLAIALSESTTDRIQVTGYDLNQEMLTIARKKAARLKASSVEFIQGDAGSMPFKDGTFDCVTIGFGFRNLTWENPHRDQFIGEISRVMKPGARLLILESARPENKLVAFFYSLYLKLVLVPLGGILSGDWQAYRYLAGSSAGFYRFDELHALLKSYRLDLKMHRIFLFGSANLLIAIKKGS